MPSRRSRRGRRADAEDGDEEMDSDDMDEDMASDNMEEDDAEGDPDETADDRDSGDEDDAEGDPNERPRSRRVRRAAQDDLDPNADPDQDEDDDENEDDEDDDEDRDRDGMRRASAIRNPTRRLAAINEVLQASRRRAVKQARRAERKRLAKIMNSEAAGQNVRQALAMATRTSMSPSAIVSVLQAAPAVSGLSERMSGYSNRRPGPGAAAPDPKRALEDSWTAAAKTAGVWRGDNNGR